MSAPMHKDEADTNPALVKALLAEQFPAWSDLPLTPVPSAGTDNALYRLGDDMLVRLPRVNWAARQVTKEQEWLPKLAPHLPLAIPAPLAAGSPTEAYPHAWSVYNWLPGQSVAATEGLDKIQLARDLAHFVKALRRARTENAPAPGGHNFGRGVPLAARNAMVDQALTDLGDRVDIAAAQYAWQDALDAPEYSEPPVWVHGDLQDGNLLVEDGRLSAVIDFGGAAIGDPAVDLLPAWNLFDASAREIYRAELNTDDAMWARGKGWALSMALIALPYYWTTNPPLVATSLHILDELGIPREPGPA